ncbi:hypothetical protein [Chryseobacterium sp. 2VB]|uniref:hypothetical protein n=1 Tax=Chryseobacterium sp. 2VB TaxID=2502204 RepID=UPI0010F71FCA|nr:hypothetical protein [Chryseobacterium sp. 2VB]
MKQLEIKTNKRLLIVEGGFMYYHNGSPLKYICKGSDLTEEVAEEFSKPVKSSHGKDGFINYLYESKEIVYSPAFVTALESFISAIESKGFIWGVNKVKYPNKESYGYHDNINILDDPPGWDEKEFYEDLDKWREAESMTFNPSKCIIFEIL